ARGRGWLTPKAVQQLFDDHMAGRVSYGQALWNLLCLELWARVFLDRTSSFGAATSMSGLEAASVT
ncbi:MAG TPA: hypothetical protein VG871_01280, partial [Vicinamibacterales bacterium]|nr:hypothetical protein [Vicinamibacterales bacterium]